MNLNYFRSAWRILKRNKAYSVINILGLGIGFSVASLLMIYVLHQLSFDRFHENADRIYRLTMEGSMNDGKLISADMTGGMVADFLLEEVPEVEQATRVYYSGRKTIMIEDQRFTGQTTAWVDSAFFRIFNFPLILGDSATAVKNPHSIVISERAAQRYFGKQDVLGQTLKLSGETYKITGVMKDMPINSHLQYDLLPSFSTLLKPESNIVKRNGLSFRTYVLRREHADPESFRQKVVEITDQRINELFGPLGLTLKHDLQPLKDIYLYSSFTFSAGGTGDIMNVYIFSFLTFFILLVAVFNFVNLMTAQSEKRAREIGFRKVIGAGKKDLISQFIGESLLIAFLAFIVALLLNELLIGPFSEMLDEKFSLIYWKDPLFLAGIIGFVIVIGVLSGMYPALYLSRYQPIIVLKGIQHGAGKGHALRKVLVSLQFSISIFLIASLLLVHKQVSFMKQKDLGFNREHVVSIENLTDPVRLSYQSLKAELMQNPSIKSITASQSVPGEDRSIQNCHLQGEDATSAIMIHENRIQHGYVQTFGMKIVEGRDFNPEMRTDTAAFIINETAVRKLALENPVGEDIVVNTMSGKIIGVVADYNFLSLHNEIDPLVLSMNQPSFYKISIRISPDNIPGTLAYLSNKFEEIDPNYRFDYQFVDEMFQQMYQKEERVNKLITAAAVLAIIISFMGLFAITSFTVAQKIKEIGIRKTLGASVNSIVLKLFGELGRWLLIGNLIAWPVAFYVVSRWQSNFAFQIDLWKHWWLFVAATLMAGIVGSMAMLSQSISAARANPIDSLKTE
ncbi:MAG: ABC transporter permease [Bacteroides sp.]|jgi:putative ABC transport system permease protein|nr:ABC transporter permease [Bacteroides sp.]